MRLLSLVLFGNLDTLFPHHLYLIGGVVWMEFWRRQDPFASDWHVHFLQFRKWKLAYDSTIPNLYTNDYSVKPSTITTVSI